MVRRLLTMQEEQILIPQKEISSDIWVKELKLILMDKEELAT